MKNEKPITGIKPEIKQLIKDDIEKCKTAKDSCKGSMKFFDDLVAKYNMLDKTFHKDLCTIGKVSGGDGFDYTDEIERAQTKLETYLLLDEIPINYHYNVAEKSSIQINAKTLNNKGGIIGNNNSQNNNNKTINENGKKKTSWFKNFTIFKRGK